MAPMSAGRAAARRFRWRRRGAGIAALCGLLGLARLEASAGFYRCQRADGSVVFTDSQATCPGASEHEPAAAVQSLGSSSGPTRWAPASLPPAHAPELDAQREAHWRQKKLEAERDLAQVSDRIRELEPFVTICNRGGYLYKTQDNGLKHKVSCDRVRDDFASLERESLELREYLDHGLGEECRTAGCLPGWLR